MDPNDPILIQQHQHQDNLRRQQQLEQQRRLEHQQLLEDEEREQMQQERRSMHELIASDTFDKAKAEAQIAKMDEQRKAHMLAHLETQNKIYNILTPEQKKQFNANFEKRLTERAAQKGKMPQAAE